VAGATYFLRQAKLLCWTEALTSHETKQYTIL
jgi:hypothetical protein